MRTIIGNWKMKTRLPEALALASQVAKAAERFPALEIVIAPSLPWIVPIREHLRMSPPNFALASQVVSGHTEGAYTGDVAASQLQGIVEYCLVGHSERRKYHGEQGRVVAEQMQQLLAHNITPVLCFGELEKSRNPHMVEQVLHGLSHDTEGLTVDQLSHCILAYEPVWAIGTGTPAEPEYIREVVATVKAHLKDEKGFRGQVLYGGSVTPANAHDLGRVHELDGVLVGGASLQAKDFAQICADFSGHV